MCVCVGVSVSPCLCVCVSVSVSVCPKMRAAVGFSKRPGLLRPDP